VEGFQNHQGPGLEGLELGQGVGCFLPEACAVGGSDEHEVESPSALGELLQGLQGVHVEDFHALLAT